MGGTLSLRERGTTSLFHDFGETAIKTRRSSGDHPMLFRQHFLEGIRSGAITVAFRRWQRPSVKSGGTLLTSIGQLHIASVRQIAMPQISENDARRAGYGSLAELLKELRQRSEGRVYRIELGPLRVDPRIALRREASLTRDTHHELSERLQRLDSHSADGPWTMRTLEVIRLNPGVRAGDLCALVGQEKDRFKPNVRKLKNLGLTESLETGYRLSPRGVAFLKGPREVQQH
jgi:hypothetical protein